MPVLIAPLPEWFHGGSKVRVVPLCGVKKFARPPWLNISSSVMSWTVLPDSRSRMGVVANWPPICCVTPHSFWRKVGGWMKPPELGLSIVCPGEEVISRREICPCPSSSTCPTHTPPFWLV